MDSTRWELRRCISSGSREALLRDFTNQMHRSIFEWIAEIEKLPPLKRADIEHDGQTDEVEFEEFTEQVRF